MTEEETTCSICALSMTIENAKKFIDIPLCSNCYLSLDLENVREVEPDPLLAELVDDKGSDILGMTAGLLSRKGRFDGWQVLAMAPVIQEQVEDLTRKVMMSSGLIILGSSLIRTGTGQQDDELDNRFVTLLILLGQYLDLAVFGKINEELNLEKGSFIHELILKEEHDHRIFRLLKALDHGEDDEKKAILANAMSILMP